MWAVRSLNQNADLTYARNYYQRALSEADQDDALPFPLNLGGGALKLMNEWQHECFWKSHDHEIF